jgi:hypothetical protein
MFRSIHSAYSNHAPSQVKQALSFEDKHKYLNPTGNALADYGIYGGAGALGGAGIGALINMLRDEDPLKGAIMGGGAGLGLGLGGRALMGYGLDNQIEGEIKKLQQEQAIAQSLYYKSLKNRDDSYNENHIVSGESTPGIQTTDSARALLDKAPHQQNKKMEQIAKAIAALEKIRNG